MNKARRLSCPWRPTKGSLTLGRTWKSFWKSNRATPSVDCVKICRPSRNAFWTTVQPQSHEWIYYEYSKEWLIKTQLLLIELLVTGIVRPGEFLAILGSSGAGKTTLLNCLTFRNTGKLTVLGQRYINGMPIDTDSLARISAYVQQDDLFIGTLTVKEQLRFQVFYRNNFKDNLFKMKSTGFAANGQTSDLSGANESRGRSHSGVGIGQKYQHSYRWSGPGNQRNFRRGKETSGLRLWGIRLIFNQLNNCTSYFQDHKILKISYDDEDFEVLPS